MLPTDHNKLMLHWREPFRVMNKIGEVDYCIEMPTGKVKTFHANMLKKYHERESSMPQTDNEVGMNEAAVAVACVLRTVMTSVAMKRASLTKLKCYHSTTIDQVQINPELNERQKRQAMSLLIADRVCRHFLRRAKSDEFDRTSNSTNMTRACQMQSKCVSNV
jgi:hypothetical protein